MAQIFYPGRPPIAVSDVVAAQLMARVRRVSSSGEHAWLDLAGDADGDTHVLLVGPNIPISVTMTTDAVPGDLGLVGREPRHGAEPVSPIDAYYDQGRRTEEHPDGP